MLNGKFQFREIAILSVDSAGSPTESAAAYGTITFDGSGRFTAIGTYLDSIISSGAPQKLATYGTYSIGRGGSGRMTNPLNPSDASSLIYGATGQGIFIGTSTEGTVNNLFIAIPAGNPVNFTSPFSVGMLDAATATSALLQWTAASQTPAVDGSFQLNSPAGVKTMFISGDANFALGWTPGGFDLVFGIKSGASGAALKGSYYVAGMQRAQRSTDPCGPVNSYFGSLLAASSGTQIVHQRLASSWCYATDFQTDDQIVADGVKYAGSGAVFVGVGGGGIASLSVGVRANDLSGTGVFLNPIGVLNAASFAPSTMSIAPGELIMLYGTGLAPSTHAMQGGETFPATLEGVQVLINNTPASIYYVSPEQISVIVPKSITSGTATIQVVNNGLASNVVTVFASTTAPGIFTQTANGLGYAAAVHVSTGALVTASNPAVAGEYLAIFATGLGTASPSVSDGALGISSSADAFKGNHLTMFFDDYENSAFRKAKVTYAGLAPGLAGLYQINLQVPDGVGPGDVYLEIATDTADVNQVMIPVGK
jgi:uncharacterized protein (TIGR03437 family)